MAVRRLTTQDEELLTAVVGRFRGLTTDDPGRFLADPRCLAWIDESEGDVTGWCWAHELSRPDGGRDLLLYELEVDETARRRGHGRALLAAVLAEAESAGYGKVWLLTDTDNAAAQALYEGAGGAVQTQRLYSWGSGENVEQSPVAK